jgi:hypothetical protein
MLKIGESDFGLAATLRIKLVLEEFGHERFGELDSCRLSRGRALLGALCTISKVLGAFITQNQRRTSCLHLMDEAAFKKRSLLDTNELARGFETA